MLNWLKIKLWKWKAFISDGAEMCRNIDFSKFVSHVFFFSSFTESSCIALFNLAALHVWMFVEEAQVHSP